MELKHQLQNDKIEILGHIFNGLEDIEKSVEVSAKIGNSSSNRFIQTKTPEIVIDGLHVLELYEPYPCFDHSDFLYENRRYCNYFFSKTPFTEETINRIATTKWWDNYCLVNENLDPSFVPAVYFGGSSWNDLIIAL